MSIKVIKINTIKCMAALNNHQACTKRTAILKVLNTVNFIYETQSGKYHILDRWQKYNNYIIFYHPDIDECATQNNLCDATNSECNNTHGSYYCQCNDGFVKNGASCEGAI